MFPSNNYFGLKQINYFTINTPPSPFVCYRVNLQSSLGMVILFALVHLYQPTIVGFRYGLLRFILLTKIKYQTCCFLDNYNSAVLADINTRIVIVVTLFRLININMILSNLTFRLVLMDRLTRGHTLWPRNPWVFGENG